MLPIEMQQSKGNSGLSSVSCVKSTKYLADDEMKGQVSETCQAWQ